MVQRSIQSHGTRQSGAHRLCQCLEDDFVERGFLVSGPGDDILVVGRDVTAQH